MNSLLRIHNTFRRSAMSSTGILLLYVSLLTPVLAADWPAYKHDPQRTSFTEETLTLPLRLAWTYKAAQPPAPAWSEPFLQFNRTTFDYAPHPVIVNGLLYFGSSADDTVRALDARTGREKWHFVSGGPVRFAPQVVNGKLYFASDDGFAYCLDATQGKLLWKFFTGPTDERFFGNGRMISRWPVRTGVLVDDGVVYCVGGMWASEGIYVYALQADTGKVIWCNDTSDFTSVGMGDFIGMGVNPQHQGEFGAGGLTPQGPLAASDNILLVPSGAGGVSRFNRKTGALLQDTGYPGGPAGAGGTWMTIDQGNQYSFAIHRAEILTVQPYDVNTGKAGKAFSSEKVPQVTNLPEFGVKRKHGSREVSAIVHDGRLYARNAYGLALAGGTLFVGGDGTVTAEGSQKMNSAELRFARAGEFLAIHARILDDKIEQSETPWKGSCVEIFGSTPGKPAIGHVFLTPQTPAAPARAFRAEGDKTVPAPDVRMQTTNFDGGYELDALVPLSLLALDANSPVVALEAQVTATTPDGRLNRNTLFGSTAAYKDSSKFGKMTLRQIGAVSSPADVKKLVTTEKPGVISVVNEGAAWSASVHGKARELAVAEGCLFVSTDDGEISCFVPAKPGETSKPLMVDAVPTSPPNRAVSDAERAILKQIEAANMAAGYALVLGDSDGHWTDLLAQETRLHVINALTDAGAVTALRNRYVTTTALYGSRINVTEVSSLAHLPFAQYFANTVLVAGSSADLPGGELFRVLHPCGGLMLFPGLSAAESEKLAGGIKAPEAKVEKSPDGVLVTRGELPGALDWNSKITKDQRVTGSLRPLWFGGPDEKKVLEYRFRGGSSTPRVAAGRYYILGEQYANAVDAYNGCVLWDRRIPEYWSDIRKVDDLLFYVSDPTDVYSRAERYREVRVNSRHAYLQLGKAYFKGKADGIIQLDLMTGKQTGVGAPFHPPTPVSLSTPQSWPLSIDDAHSGTIEMQAQPDGIALTLRTQDPAVTPEDGWNLCFDFRPLDQRYGLYEHGAFEVRITPSNDANRPATCAFGNGPAHPQLKVTGTPQPGGTRTTVFLPWSEVEKLVGARPKTFDFAATLDSYDAKDAKERIVRRHLFGDWASGGLNNGWSRVSEGAAITKAEAELPPALLSKINDSERTGFVKDAKYISDEVSEEPRINPLSGELEPKNYRSGTGTCGTPYYSATSLFRRASGMLGIYDFADDSGLRFFNGVKAGCTTPQVAALGVLLISDEVGHCICNYPFRGSVVLAPAERRLNEDWALFYDRAVDTQVRHAAINMGAPGDRRDDDGRLWLGYPRPPARGFGWPLVGGKPWSVGVPGVWLRFEPSVMQVPLTVQCFDDPKFDDSVKDVVTAGKNDWALSWVPNRARNPFGAYRLNTDYIQITGTDRPWIYGSGYRGIQKATMKLNFLKPLATKAADQPVILDGKLNEATWSGDPNATLPYTKSKVYLRHDANNLYIAVTRPSVVDRHGKVAPWTRKTTGDDAQVWDDDSWEVFLTDARQKQTIHLGVSASGARYDARQESAPKEDKSWNGVWTDGVSATDDGLSFEIAIPWKTIADAGLQKDELAINFQMNQKDISQEAITYPGSEGRNFNPPYTSGEALSYLGINGREHCINFAPLGIGRTPTLPDRQFTVRLHFAETGGAQPGQRVFDVKVQGKTVLKGLDVVKEAGGPYKALVKEFTHVAAGDTLTIEFAPASGKLTPETAPILSALELKDEQYDRPKLAMGTDAR